MEARFKMPSLASAGLMFIFSLGAFGLMAQTRPNNKATLPTVVPTTDFNKVIIPEDSVVSEFEEKLVQAAWKNFPQNRAVQARYYQSLEDKSITSKQWLSEVVLFAQTNFVGYLPDGRQTFSLPAGFGAGLSFNVGQFLNQGDRNRRAQQEVILQNANVEYQKHFVRYETLRRYNNYLMFKNLLKTHSELADDQLLTLKVMKLNFETGQVAVEEYSKIQKAYNDAVQLTISSEYQMRVYKAELESIIGVKLEEIK